MVPPKNLRGLVLQPIPGLEDPRDDAEADEEKHERHRKTQADANVGRLMEAPAKAADQINDRVKQAHGAPRRRQHVDRVECAAQKRQRRDDEHRDELELLEAVGPQTDDEAEKAERGRGEHKETDHPERMHNLDRHEQGGGRENHKPQHDRLRRPRADLADDDLERRDRRRQNLVDRAGELGKIDAERRVHDALREQREHHQARDDERAVRYAADLRHARADRRAENHEVERRRDHRRHHALQQRPQRARHLELVDRGDGVAVESKMFRYRIHFRSLTRLTKISSSELWRVSRSVKPIPSSATRRTSSGMPVSSSLPLKVYSSSRPPSFNTRRQSDSSRGIAASGACRRNVSCFLPSCFISFVFSSTTMSPPLWTTPIRSAISSASAIWGVGIMIVTPWARSPRTSPHRPRRSSTSTPAVGSSRNSISGSCASALATSPRRFMPPESVMILLLRLSQSDRPRSTRSMCAGSGPRLKRRRLKLTVAHTVSNMSVVSSCGTRPIFARAAR